MGTERRRQIVLTLVALVLALVVYQAWPRTSAAPNPSSNDTRATATTGAARGAAANAANPPGTPQSPDVHLEALEAERPKPAPADRNLFRFKPKAPPPPPPTTTKPSTGSVPVTQVPTGPPPPPPAPPITLKFIGIADPGGGRAKIAVLTDGLGPPIAAAEGSVVFGRYRILKIGVESIEMAYLDGRGRQTIRLTGS